MVTMIRVSDPGPMGPRCFIYAVRDEKASWTIQLENTKLGFCKQRNKNQDQSNLHPLPPPPPKKKKKKKKKKQKKNTNKSNNCYVI